MHELFAEADCGGNMWVKPKLIELQRLSGTLHGHLTLRFTWFNIMFLFCDVMDLVCLDSDIKYYEL
jgi:hypothetical protein